MKSVKAGWVDIGARLVVGEGRGKRIFIVQSLTRDLDWTTFVSNRGEVLKLDNATLVAVLK